MTAPQAFATHNLKPNTHRRRDSTVEVRRVGVGDVYWLLYTLLTNQRTIIVRVADYNSDRKERQIKFITRHKDL